MNEEFKFTMNAAPFFFFFLMVMMPRGQKTGQGFSDVCSNRKIGQHPLSTTTLVTFFIEGSTD